MRTRLVIVDDDEAVRSSVREAFREPRGQPVVEFSDGASAFAELPHIQPEAVILDIRMPRMDGLECLHRVRPLLPASRIILFTGLRREDVAQAAISGRANGFVHKATGTEACLQRVIQRATPEDLLFPYTPLHGSAGPILPQLALEAASPSLSPREQQIVDLLARGHTNKEIAGELGLALQSLHNLLHRMRQRWHCRNSTELVARTGRAEPGNEARKPPPEE